MGSWHVKAGLLGMMLLRKSYLDDARCFHPPTKPINNSVLWFIARECSDSSERKARCKGHPLWRRHHGRLQHWKCLALTLLFLMWILCISISIYDINICLEGGLPILEREIYLDCRFAFSGKDSWTNHTLEGSNSNYDSWLCWLHLPFRLEKATESFESFVKLSSLWYRFNHRWSIAVTYIVASIFHLKSNKLGSVCPLVTVLLVCMFQAQTQVELGILTILVLPSMQESAWFGAGLSWTTDTAILWGIPAGESEQKIAWCADTHLVARSASHHYPQHALWQVCWTGCLVNMGKAL